MNAKERTKVQSALADARNKARNGNGKHPKEHYEGWVSALEWVLVEA